MAPNKTVRVGIIGCGEITQVAHIPNLGFLQDLFQITQLCDISQGALDHCRKRIVGNPSVNVTRYAEELCSAPDVDLVMVANSDAFHAPHALLALKHNKHVFVEKPMAMSLKDIDVIIDAEKAAGGAKVFVGYMRRYATAFLDLADEIGADGLEGLRYVKVRDIVGWNKPVVAQSGTFPHYFTDFSESDKEELKQRSNAILQQGLSSELGVPVNETTSLMWTLLGGLGSHDLSAMRELFGMPKSVVGASMCASTKTPFWSGMFQYPGFVVSYESGIDNVERFDASIEMFFDEKTIKICFDTPYIRGLPVTTHIREKTRNGAFTDSVVRRTYEDPYTLEMKSLYEFVANGKPTKTTAVDARQDVEIFGMFMKACNED